MEHQPRIAALDGPVAVFEVADDGVADVVEVDTDLMAPPRRREDPHEGGAVERERVRLLLALLDASAATVSLRDWFDALPAVYPTQQETDRWTFRAGGADGQLIAPSASNYYGPETYQQIGSRVDIGTFGCTPGFCPVDVASTLATFNGVFVHPGSAQPTSAVFRADAAMRLDEIELWSEGVANANNGNGFAVNVSAVIGGVTQAIGSFDFSWATTLHTRDERLFTPGLLLGAGDKVVISYGSNGSYLYDHGNVEAVLRTSAAGNPVAEPGTVLLAAAGLIAAAAVRRRARRARPARTA